MEQGSKQFSVQETVDMSLPEIKMAIYFSVSISENWGVNEIFQGGTGNLEKNP